MHIIIVKKKSLFPMLFAFIWARQVKAIQRGVCVCVCVVGERTSDKRKWRVRQILHPASTSRLHAHLHYRSSLIHFWISHRDIWLVGCGRRRGQSFLLCCLADVFRLFRGTFAMGAMSIQFNTVATNHLWLRNI